VTELVFIHGPAASGKLTVARELAERTGFRLFHNHLGVDLAAALFDFGTPPFVALREQVWMDAFRVAGERGVSLIFTFHPEASVSPEFPDRVVELLTSLGGRVHFVELVCSEEEIERRIESPSRAAFGKLRSLDAYRSLRESGAFRFAPLPAPVCRVDTGVSSPRDAAQEIASRLERASRPGDLGERD